MVEPADGVEEGVREDKRSSLASSFPVTYA